MMVRDQVQFDFREHQSSIEKGSYLVNQVSLITGIEM